MKYFTPEMYFEFNSPDDKIADELEGQWERNIEKYQEDLLTFPQVAQDFTKELGSFHDGTYNITKDGDTFVFDVEYDMGGSARILIECLQHVTEKLVWLKGFWNEQNPIFLYDEFGYTEGKLSYYFFDSAGNLQSFRDISSLRWGRNERAD